MEKIKTCVIICYWRGTSTRRLHQLLNQMLKIDAGTAYDLAIVCNGGDESPLVLPRKFDALRAKIFNRENVGYNIMAWDFGWRSVGNYEYYLFLQDECFLKKTGWISEFEYRMEIDEGIGILGEYIMWDNMSWPYIRQATDRDLGTSWYSGESMHPIEFYQNFLTKHNIPLTQLGSHVMCIILFTKLTTLQEINGFTNCISYREAVSSEIGLSRLVASKGYRISYVKDERFVMIGHYQWIKHSPLTTSILSTIRHIKAHIKANVIISKFVSLLKQ